jgi:tetratricopeptide (TPR) repeat protein
VPHRARRAEHSGARTAALAVAALALAAVVSACGDSSGSGGGADAKPTTPAGNLAAAILLQQQGKLGQAKDLYLKVITAQPSNYYAQYDLGVLAQHDGDDAHALTYYGAALAANPKYVPALYNEATIYAASNPALAIATYRRAIALQPSSPTAELNLGLLEVKNGEVHQGVQDLALAVSEDSALQSAIPKNLQSLVRAVKPASTPTSSSSS